MNIFTVQERCCLSDVRLSPALVERCHTTVTLCILQGEYEMWSTSPKKASDIILLQACLVKVKKQTFMLDTSYRCQSDLRAEVRGQLKTGDRRGVSLRQWIISTLQWPADTWSHSTPGLCYTVPAPSVCRIETFCKNDWFSLFSSRLIVLIAEVLF